MISMKSLSAAALVGAGVLVSAQVPPDMKGQRLPQNVQLIPWSTAAGRPKVNFQKSVGIYVWHEGNRFHILSADDKPAGQVVNGVVALRGKGQIFDIDPIQNEKTDKFSRKQNNVRYHFATKKEVDGMEFSFTGGRTLIVRVNQKGPQQRLIYIGNKLVTSLKPTIAFDLRK